MSTHAVTSTLCRHGKDAIWYRDRNLVDDLIGKTSFTEALFYHALGRPLTSGETRVIDAILVTLIEHGFTPSAIATRLIYMSAPEAMQGAVAAGLLGVGSQFIGSMENCARLLGEIVAGETTPETVVTNARAERRHLPGFGHHLHSPDDPRAIALLRLAREENVARPHVAAIEQLSEAVDIAAGRHVTINATGAIAAILADMGVPAIAMRGWRRSQRGSSPPARFFASSPLTRARMSWPSHCERWAASSEPCS